MSEIAERILESLRSESQAAARAEAKTMIGELQNHNLNENIKELFTLLIEGAFFAGSAWGFRHGVDAGLIIAKSKVL